MTLRSSDGCPKRTDAERQASATRHLAKQEDAASRPMPTRPRVLVAAQPAVGSDEDRERGQDREANQDPHELQRGQAKLTARDRLDDEILRQSLHQQERDAASSAAVGTAPGPCAGL
jgi:hypothetical protein